MSAIKAALKAAKQAIDAGDYDKAIDEAHKVLASDAKNYFGLLFLGRASEKQGRLEDAAKAYRSAAEAKPEDSQAWLGLCSLYEAQGQRKVDEYREAAVKTAEIFANADDRDRCQTTVDKVVAFAKQHGTRNQYKKALEVILPNSSLYDFLEGRIPRPSDTYIRLAEITEDDENQTIKQEIAARRTRIGARLGQVTADVKREVFNKTELEDLYQNVINWSSNDEIRRQYEEKLLERAYEALTVLKPEQKGPKLGQVLTLAEGMVIIRHPFQLAWNLVLESRDLDDLTDLDAGILRDYIELFPESGLGKILKGWLSSELSPFPYKLESEDDKQPQEQISPEDRLLLMTEGVTAVEKSPFAHRLVCDYYLHLEENEGAADTARAGLTAVANESSKLGMGLQNTKDAMNSVLATALVHYQAPRNHAEARRLFEDILKRKPKWTPALIGLGLIFEENEDYANAISFLSQALTEDSSNVRVGTELAWCRALNGGYTQAQEELETYLAEMKADDPRARDLRAQILYRIGICIWEIHTARAARKDRNGAYARFLSAIKANVNFAPAYTSLGIYYADYSKDKKRARQCFQKAFELSPAETLAAERLANSFADQGDWDIVEVIAQRVIDTGRARPPPGSKRKGLSWPYSALGVVQMNKLEYQQAITSFLAALRISPDDYQSYVGLGESYHNSGRYNSAMRTFNYALEPHDGMKLRITEERWFATYMLANVHRELGEYDEAIIGLQEVLSERSTEFGVLLSLLQTFVEKAESCLEAGLFGQAIESAQQAISTATTIVNDRPKAFNVWKAVGDACLIFSWVWSRLDDFPATELRQLLSLDQDSSMYDYLSEIDQVRVKPSTEEVNGERAHLADPLTMGILAYKRAISSCSHDIHAQAVAWYNLGWAEHRAYSCPDAKSGRKYLKAAVRCFKRAIELEAGNAEFWNALGVVTTILNPKVAQHSFVRSLHLNELNAKVWANLGVLYLLQTDYELAHQAFGRAQSTDPSYGQAWIGEGHIAMLSGNSQESLSHFTHAFEISDSSSVISKQMYTMSTFDHLLNTPSASNDLTALVQPIFGSEQLQRQNPHDLPYQHLAALFLERVGNYSAAIQSLTRLCEVAEAEYEASESLAALARFAHAKSDLARNQLAAKDFESAVENAVTALDLSPDAGTSELDAEARSKLRLSSHLTAGLTNYYLHKSSDSIGMFKTALQESNDDAEVVCALVKVLWTQGGDEEKAVAREQLFECVERHPEHVASVTLLGNIAVLDDDQDTALAVRDDLLSLRTMDGISLGEQEQIETLLSALATLLPSEDGEEDDDAELSVAQVAIMLNPDHPQAWNRLADLSGETSAANMVLKTAQKAVPPSGALEPKTLAKAFAGAGTIGDAQRAISLAPWEPYGRSAMNEALSK